MVRQQVRYCVRGVISPVLANLALDGLEDAVYSALGPNKTARKPAKAHVVRYADDFIVTGVSRELLERRVKPAVEEFLAVRGLQLAPEKTLITHISRGFDFLGQNVRKYGNKLLIKPARKSVNALLKRVSEVLGRNKAATQAQVILLLNPILGGWALYHRHVVAAATFLQVDHLVWSKVWRCPNAGILAKALSGSRRGTSNATVYEIGSSPAAPRAPSRETESTSSELRHCPYNATRRFAARPTRSTPHGLNTSSVDLMPDKSVVPGPVRLRAVGGLEPCAGKLASTVLRRRRRSNAPLLPGDGIDAYHGRARFCGPRSIEVGGEVLEGQFILVATGAVPMRLGIPGEEHLLTSTEFLELDRLPGKIVFLG